MSNYKSGDFGEDSIFYATVNAISLLKKISPKSECKDLYNSLIFQVNECRSPLEDINKILCHGSDMAFDHIDQYPSLKVQCHYNGNVTCLTKVCPQKKDKTVIIVQYANRSWGVVPTNLQEGLALNVKQVHSISLN